MPATLQDIRIKLAEATALRDDAADAMPLIIAAGGSITAEARRRHEAKLNGYQREVIALQKVERDLQSEQRAESRFNAPVTESALLTPPPPSDASQRGREGSRSEASAAPLPASGDVF